MEHHIRIAIKGDDLQSQKGFKKIFEEDYVIETAFADITEEVTNIYMKIAQEDKALLDKFGVNIEIKQKLLKRYWEFRKRIIKKETLNLRKQLRLKYIRGLDVGHLSPSSPQILPLFLRLKGLLPT